MKRLKNLIPYWKGEEVGRLDATLFLRRYVPRLSA
jgi:hypothetical protein